MLVRGEVSNCNRNKSSGHVYFTMKDAEACIDCVVFRGDAARVKFDLRDGNRIENPALDENHPVVRDGRIWKIERRDEILRVQRSRKTRR